MKLFYEDEDQILPLLLHRVDEGQPACQCRDCEGIRARMIKLRLDLSEASPLVAALTPLPLVAARLPRQVGCNM